MPARVERGTAVIAARPQDHGGFRLGLEIEGVEAPVEAAKAIVARAVGRLGLWIDAAAGRVIVASVDKGLRDAWSRLEPESPCFPDEAEAALAEHLAQLGTRLPVRAFGALRGAEVAAEPSYRLRLSPIGDAGSRRGRWARVWPTIWAWVRPSRRPRCWSNALPADRRSWSRRPRSAGTGCASSAASRRGSGRAASPTRGCRRISPQVTCSCRAMGS